MELLIVTVGWFLLLTIVWDNDDAFWKFIFFLVSIYLAILILADLFASSIVNVFK